VFKVLSAKKIENYLQKEKPYNCAGSFKSEALGISLLIQYQSPGLTYEAVLF
jgi:predicted house-cleaning NTP pyrophosphatase (Maf/HAM1 superfamily)